jgi:hypothetical protein
LSPPLLRIRWRASLLLLAVVVCGVLPAVRARAEERSAAPSSPLFDAGRATGEAAVYFDTNGVTVVTPSAEASTSRGAWTAQGHYAADIVSAASVDIVSSASSRWDEVRHEASLAVIHEDDESRSRLGGQASIEPDFASLGAQALYTLELDEPGVLWGLGASFAHDTAGRTGTPFSVYSQTNLRYGVLSALELTLDRSTTFGIELDLSLEHGDSSKPYRFLPLFSPNVAPRVDAGATIAEVNQLRLPGRVREAVPSERRRLSLSGRLGRRWTDFTLQAFLRGYADDWGLVAVTSEVRGVRDAGKRVRLWGFGRVHTQTGVAFWERAYAAIHHVDGTLVVPRYRTGDRELGPLLAATLGLGAQAGLSAGADPFDTFVTVQADQQLTRFLDALYIEERRASLFVLQVGSVW